jgi:hypothetical protein
MPLFAERLGRTRAETLTPTEATWAANEFPVGSVERATTSRETVAHETAPLERARESASREVARPGRIRRAARAVNASRAVWFVLGALGGVVGALALTAYVATTQVSAPQTLVVALDGSAPFTSITAALAFSRPGDIVRVEPGIYREQVDLHSGADLVARVPGTVTIARPPESTAPTLSLAGPFNVRVAGIRIDSDSPAETGVRIAAAAATLELVEITGAIRRAIDVFPGSTLAVRGSRIAITGMVLALPDDAYATLVNCVVVRAAPRSRWDRRRAWSCAATCSRGTAPTSSKGPAPPDGSSCWPATP